MRNWRRSVNLGGCRTRRRLSRQRDRAVESAEFAARDRPEIAIETDAIEALYDEISTKRPDLLHPNSRSVTRKLWGALEFALRDSTQVCVIFRQWPVET